jgi:hypothetical protein
MFLSLAAWVGDYLEQVMVAQVSYGLCPMCEIPNSALMGHSTFQPLNNSRDQHIYLELLENNSIEDLHTLGVCPICNQFRPHTLCNVYRLWQPDDLHQLLLGIVEDILHWLLQYLKACNVKDQFDSRFTSVAGYPSNPPNDALGRFHLMKSIFPELKMSKTALANVDNLLAMEAQL